MVYFPFPLNFYDCGSRVPSYFHFSLFRSNVDNRDERPKADKLSLKKKGIGSEARAERMANADADLQLLGDAERERQLNKQKKRRRQGHEEEVYFKLMCFRDIFCLHISRSSWFSNVIRNLLIHKNIE